MHADGFGQVAIALGIVGDDLADEGQHAKGEGVIGATQRLPDLGEFQHQCLAASLEDAMDLLQGLFLVGHVAQAEGQRHAVEALVGERQFLGVALHGGDGQAVIQRPVTPHGQHGGVDVGHPDLDARLFGHGAGQVSTAGGQIQHLHARAKGRLTHGEVLPEPVQTARHQVVHQVIAAGHRIEHATHPASLLGGIDLLVAKMGFLVGVGHESLREWCFCLRVRSVPSPGSGTPGDWDCPGSGRT